MLGSSDSAWFAVVGQSSKFRFDIARSVLIIPCMQCSPILAALGFLITYSCIQTQAAEQYPVDPDAMRRDGVPQGELHSFTWNNSSIFPGTHRDYWVYVPAQYNPEQPASVMVFQDGEGYIKPEGSYRVPIVFDNLIHKGEMPVTIAIFINPGVVPAAHPTALPRYNRSFEYDSTSDRYARFLIEEILPAVGEKWNLSDDPNKRAIGGASSGAICAFTVAWERPDAFRRVFSTIGTYVGLRGGHNYPTLIRKFEPKPIKIFLQDGSSDLNIYAGDWWVANQSMLSALQWSGYEVRYVWGEGGHNSRHGGAIFADAMRWLWDNPDQPISATNQNSQRRIDMLLQGEDWEQVAAGYRFTEGPAVNEEGEVFFTDIPNNRIYKIGLDGHVSLFAENTGGANGLMFWEDNRLYACANDRRQIVAYNMYGQVDDVIVEDVTSNDLATFNLGGYFTDPSNRQVYYVNRDGEEHVVDTGIARPNGIILSPDQTLLYVSDTHSRMVYSFQIQPDGSLSHKQPYFHLHIPEWANDSGADGMTVDTEGRLYVTTRLGLQVCDQAGRVNLILSKPQNAWLSNVVFGGADLDTLYVTCGDKVYKRKVAAKGLLSWHAPLTPPKPRL